MNKTVRLSTNNRKRNKFIFHFQYFYFKTLYFIFEIQYIKRHFSLFFQYIKVNFYQKEIFAEKREQRNKKQREKQHEKFSAFVVC